MNYKSPGSRYFIAIFTFFSLLTLTSIVHARLGVGVATGKIEVDENLRPGVIYELPAITVLNTGDEPAEYGIGVAYHQDQPEHQPPKEWFSFKPSRFHLNPGEGRAVEIVLTVPLKTVPGKYFAYVEGFPVKSEAGGDTSINIAAATKLYFTVEPANIFQGLYYRVKSLWENTQPYSAIGLAVVGVVIAAKIAGKYVNIDVNLKKKNKSWEKVQSIQQEEDTP